MKTFYYQCSSCRKIIRQHMIHANLLHPCLIGWTFLDPDKLCTNAPARLNTECQCCGALFHIPTDSDASCPFCDEPNNFKPVEVLSE